MKVRQILGIFYCYCTRCIALRDGVCYIELLERYKNKITKTLQGQIKRTVTNRMKKSKALTHQTNG